MKNALNWFEIRSADFDRAAKFYSAILAAPLRHEVIAGVPNAILPHEDGPDSAVGGSVVFDPKAQPSANGTLPYLNCDGQLDAILARVGPAGGKVITPKAETPFGHIAIIQDSEGNHIGLHAS